ncbi:hypothetical protein BKI52_43540 [marine bacterium AO1-C]|nr:hypothetical protein BKI52_43540 [marine bacterium AO1-C]
MWKSKFNNLGLTAQNTLSKQQMRHVKGGGSATADCGGGKSVTCSGDNCIGVNDSGCSCDAPSGGLDVKLCSQATNVISGN